MDGLKVNTIKQLENKVAIVTGAASGIGKATALLLAQEGARVVVSDITEEDGKKVVREIEDNGGEALFVKADTSRSEDGSTPRHKSPYFAHIFAEGYAASFYACI